MLSRRLFEGPNIQKVLARIQSELGPSAQVVSAEKVRRGGVGGFFARETYQVVVEAPDQPEAKPSLWPGRRRPVPAAPEPVATPQAGPRKVAVPSTEGAPFADVLRRLTENAEPPPVAAAGTTDGARTAASTTSVDATVDEDLMALLRQMPSAPATIRGAPEAESAEEWLADAGLKGAGDDAGAMPGAHGITSPAAVIPDEAVMSDHEAMMEATEMSNDTEMSDETEMSNDTEMSDDTVMSGQAGMMDDLPLPGRDLPMPLEDLPMAADERRGALGQLQPLPLPTEEVRTSLTGITPARARPVLKKMGVPTSLLPADGRLGLVPALYRSLSKMPPAPAVCLQPGEVMAVIGSADRALLLASRLALSIGLDPGEVVVASPGDGAEAGADRVLITSGAAAESHAEQWATRPRPTVVSIAAAPGSGREAWACSVVSALQPAAVWGVVDATRKPEDVSAWSRAVGQVDALALEDLDSTTSPAAVLGTGIPVALMDGQLASPEAWTALLAGRLRAAA